MQNADRSEHDSGGIIKKRMHYEAHYCITEGLRKGSAFLALTLLVLGAHAQSRVIEKIVVCGKLMLKTFSFLL